MDIEVNTLAQIKAETGRDLDNQVDENTLVSGEKSNGTFGVFKLFAAIKNCIDNWITTIAGAKNFTGAVTINSKAVATTEAVNNALANYQSKDWGTFNSPSALLTNAVYYIYGQDNWGAASGFYNMIEMHAFTSSGYCKAIFDYKGGVSTRFSVLDSQNLSFSIANEYGTMTFSNDTDLVIYTRILAHSSTAHEFNYSQIATKSDIATYISLWDGGCNYSIHNGLCTVNIAINNSTERTAWSAFGVLPKPSAGNIIFKMTNSDGQEYAFYILASDGVIQNGGYALPTGRLTGTVTYTV